MSADEQPCCAGVTFKNGKLAVPFPTTGSATTYGFYTGGGGLSLNGIQVISYIEGCRFESNTNQVTVTGQASTQNTGWGGAVYVGSQMRSVDVFETSFYQNKADVGGAVAIFSFGGDLNFFAQTLTDPPAVSFVNTLFKSNVASMDGGGVAYFGARPARLADGWAFSCRSNLRPGSTNTFPVAPQSLPGIMIMQNSVFDSNTAGQGFIFQNAPGVGFTGLYQPFYIGGGAIALYNANAIASSVSFFSNIATTGAIVLAFASSSFTGYDLAFPPTSSWASIGSGGKSPQNLDQGYSGCTSVQGTIALITQTPNGPIGIANGVAIPNLGPTANLNQQVLPSCGDSSLPPIYEVPNINQCPSCPTVALAVNGYQGCDYQCPTIIPIYPNSGSGAQSSVCTPNNLVSAANSANNAACCSIKLNDCVLPPYNITSNFGGFSGTPPCTTGFQCIGGTTCPVLPLIG